MKKISFVSLTTFLITLCLFTQKAQAYTLSITQKELQTMIEIWFPVTQPTAIGDVKLSSPKIRMPDDTGRINFAVNINLEMPDQYIAKGNGVIDGKLDYNAERGEFYLREPRLLKLEVDGLPSSYDAIVLSVINDLTQQQLPLIVVYRLDKEEIGQASVLRTLKSVRVQKGRLLLELGL
jgi:hypothetical protein